MSYTQRRFGYRPNLYSGVPRAAARRIAAGESAAAARRDAAIIARSAVPRYAVPAPMPRMRAPSRYRTGGYSFRSQGGKELNFLDTTITTLGLSTTGSVTLLNGMAQGTTASTRIGRKIVIKSIQINLRAFAGTTGTLADCRMALVYDMQSNGAAPLISDVYNAVDATSARNISNAQRFKVLWVWEDCLIGNSTAPVTGGEELVIQKWLNCNLVTQFNAGNAGTVGDIQTGGLFLLTMGDAVAGNTSGLTSGNIRIRYAD